MPIAASPRALSMKFIIFVADDGCEATEIIELAFSFGILEIARSLRGRDRVVAIVLWCLGRLLTTSPRHCVEVDRKRWPIEAAQITVGFDILPSLTQSGYHHVAEAAAIYRIRLVNQGDWTGSGSRRAVIFLSEHCAVEFSHFIPRRPNSQTRASASTFVGSDGLQIFYPF